MNARDVLRRATEPAVLTDGEGRVLTWNEAFARTFGLPADGPERPGARLQDCLVFEDVFGNPYAWPFDGFVLRLEQGRVLWPFEVDVRAPGADTPVRAVCAVVVFVGPYGDAQLAVFLHRRPRRRASDHAVDWVLRHPTPPLPGMVALGEVETRRAADDGSGLTDREREVLGHLAAGHDNQGIATTLRISVHTVRSHVQSILRKLNVHSQLEAVAVALRGDGTPGAVDAPTVPSCLGGYVARRPQHERGPHRRSDMGDKNPKTKDKAKKQGDASKDKKAKAAAAEMAAKKKPAK